MAYFEVSAACFATQHEPAGIEGRLGGWTGGRKRGREGKRKGGRADEEVKKRGMAEEGREGRPSERSSKE